MWKEGSLQMKKINQMKKLIGLLLIILFTSCANRGLQTRKYKVKSRTPQAKHCRYRTTPNKFERIFIR